MEAPVSASLGVVRSLPAKLQQLLSPELEADDGLRLHKAEKSKVRLLKDLLQELIDKYLMEPSEEVEAPAATARCWMKEVRELSYDIDDFLHELIHGYHTDSNNLRGKIPWLRQGLTRSRWIANQGSQLRARLRDAIRRHKNYNLDRCMMLASSIASEKRHLPAATALLVGIDGPMEKIQEWLIGDGESNLRLVSIVGFGGVGKTTLAKELYSKIESQFECRAFARTSQKPDIRKLLASILLQVRPERPPDANSESSNLIDTIRAHLQHKKYFIIIDDLWASSTWDIVCRALPDNKCCSRVLTTTEIDVVAQRCCGHNSEYIFKMGPLREDEARTLFFSRFPGDQSGSCDQSEVLFDIVRKCGGFPLATVTISNLLARQHSLIEQCNYTRRSLSSNLRTNPSMEGMKQVLNLCYNNLPCRLKACMLYISIYKEDHIIWKDDLVKQWIAEGFICAKQGYMEEVASAYFDELVSRGFIQPEDINYSGEVLSCTVHYIILNLIRYRSVEENFVTAIDCTQTNIRLADKVRRLSLLFGDADDAEQPANLRLSNIRSLVFDGLFKILPSIVEFRHLRVLILHIWGDQDNISFDLTTLRELFGLRYLQMVCNVTLNLQTEMQGLKYLETLKIDSRVTEVPQDIVHLPGLLHLSLPGGTNLPDGIERLATLRTFECFDLTCNSAETVLSLGELTSIRDLRLTCSEPQSYNLKKNMDQLSSVISNLRNLKSLTLLLASVSFKENSLVGSTASSTDISFDLSNVSSPPILLEKFELMPWICILSILPEWLGELRLLSILKIEVMGLSGGDIDILKGLPALTALSLYVRTVPAERVIFHKDGFPILKHLMFICPALCIAFVDGAMPNVRRLKLGFNANTIAECSIEEAGFENLAVLEVLSTQIGGTGAYELSRKAVCSAMEDTFRQRSPPIIDVQLVDWVFYSDKEIGTASATKQTAEESSTKDIITPLPHVGDDREPVQLQCRHRTPSRSPPPTKPDVPPPLHLLDVVFYKDKEIGTASGTQQTAEEFSTKDINIPLSHVGDDQELVQLQRRHRTRSLSHPPTKPDARHQPHLLDVVFYKDTEIGTASGTQQTAEEPSSEDIITPLPNAANDLDADLLQQRHKMWRSPSPPPTKPDARRPPQRWPRGCGRRMLPGPLFSECGRVWSTFTWVKTAAKSEGSDGLLWWRGLARCHGGRASVAVVQANRLLEDYCRLESARLVGTLIGIFDGHGGFQAAAFACDHLLPYIQKASSGQRGVTTDAIRKAFEDIEEGFLALVSRHWEMMDPSIATVGTCCLIGIVQRGTLFVANLGNSRAVLGKMGTNGQITPEQLSYEHDVSQEAVRNELIAQHPDDPGIVVLKHGVWRVKGIIKTSRSIGDAYLKHAKYNSESIHWKFRLHQPISKPLLRADPDIVCRKLKSSDRFVIFASDGLWAHLSNEEAVKIVHNHQPAVSARRLVESAMKVAAEKREMRYSHLKEIDKGIRVHFHDDITAIVLFIDYNLLVKDSAQGQDLSIRYPQPVTPAFTNF